MESLSVFDVIKQVLTSWQVIVITIVIFLYIQIVNYVSRRYHRPRSMKKIKINIFKKKDKSSELSSTDDMLPGSSSNDDLGLEEA
ncbi:MAG: hypothetical protein FWD47_14330 [Treponema sp.]|nr:hypothetical protein [Treponema sp.]